MSLQFIHNIDALRIDGHDALLCLQGDKTVAAIDLYGNGETPMAHILHGLYMTPDLPIRYRHDERRGDIVLNAHGLRAIETQDQGERVLVIIRGAMDVCIWVNK